MSQVRVSSPASIGGSGVELRLLIPALVLALRDLEIKSGTLSVNHDGPGVEKLLAGAVIVGEAAHHAEREEELNRQRTEAVGNVDHAAEIDSVEIHILREVSQQRPD